MNRIHMVPVTPNQCGYSMCLCGARTTTEQKKSPLGPAIGQLPMSTNLVSLGRTSPAEPGRRQGCAATSALPVFRELFASWSRILTILVRLCPK